MITAEMIKEVRTRTGLGIVDIRNALVKANGDIDLAIEDLRAHSATQVRDRGHRAAKEGTIGSYVHLGSKVGVLVEVNCETDFVARSPEFREFVSNLTLHICAAAPKHMEWFEVPADLVRKEVDIIVENSEKLDGVAKTQFIQGRMNSLIASICLMEQPFIKNTDRTIRELITELSAKFKEKIVIKRFARYQLGE